MVINSSFFNLYCLNSNPNLDKLAKIKEYVHNATNAFLQFCSYFIEPYLEDDLLKPHLQKINDLCIYETNPYLEVYLANILIILEKDPHLLEAYMTIIQNVKNVLPHLLELDQIADDPIIIKKHLQMIQEIGKLNDPELLKIHLTTIKKLPNNFNVELYLKNINTLCNFQPQLLNSCILTSSFIGYLESSFLEIHLNNMNNIPLYLLENYINIICNLNTNLKLLKLYLHAISITQQNYELLEAHQQNIQNIYSFPLHILETYLKSSLSLGNNTTLLEHYIKSIYHINYTQNIQYLEFHFENIHCINKKLLEPYLQNTYHLNAFILSNYIQTIHGSKHHRDRASVIYYTHNTTYISQSQPDVQDLYHTVCQALENNQQSLFFYSYVTYFISQKHPKSLKFFFKIVQLLENTQSNLSPSYRKTIHSEPNLLVKYISKILWIELREKVHSSFYISSIYIAYFITKNHSNLINLYNDSYTTLENQQEDLLFHLCHVFYISQKHPELLQKHLEIILSLANTYSRLLWPHFKNIQNNYNSGSDFFNEYIFKTSDLENNPDLLVTHICHTFNRHRIKKDHPLLLKRYQLLIEYLKNHPETTSCHVLNTYHISILLPDSLKMYLEIVQKTIDLPRNDPKCMWLNNHLQNIQAFTLKDSIALKNHLLLISQVDYIFEGKMILKEEIAKNMDEKEKKAFISISSTIMPYVTAKILFLYIFSDKYNQLDPCFFPSEIKQEIVILRKETHKYTISKIQNIFYELLTPIEQKKEFIKESKESPFENIQVLWMNSIQEENNLFMQCWKEAALDLSPSLKMDKNRSI